MTATFVVFIAIFLLGATTGIFFLLVIGIRRGDRSADLATPPDTRADAATRRVLGVGIRQPSDRDENERG